MPSVRARYAHESNDPLFRMLNHDAAVHAVTDQATVSIVVKFYVVLSRLFHFFFVMVKHFLGTPAQTCARGTIDPRHVRRCTLHPRQ